MRKVAKLIMIDSDGKHLLMYRSDHPRFGIDPDLPGGTLEYKESLVEALEREVLEETSAVVDIKKAVMIYAGSDYSKHGTYYALFVIKMEKRSDIKISWEHSKFEWIDREDFLCKAKNANDTYMNMVFDSLSKTT